MYAIKLINNRICFSLYQLVLVAIEKLHKMEMKKNVHIHTLKFNLIDNYKAIGIYYIIQFTNKYQHSRFNLYWINNLLLAVVNNYIVSSVVYLLKQIDTLPVYFLSYVKWRTDPEIGQLKQST